MIFLKTSLVLSVPSEKSDSYNYSLKTARFDHEAMQSCEDYNLQARELLNLGHNLAISPRCSMKNFEACSLLIWFMSIKKSPN